MRVGVAAQHASILLVASLYGSAGAFIGESVPRLPNSGVSSHWRLGAESTATADTEAAPGETVEFPPPISSFDRFKRAATFWSTALPIVANYYGLMSNLKLMELLGNPPTESDIEVSNPKPACG